MLSYYLLKWNLVLRPPEPYGMVKWMERNNFLLSCVDPTISSLALLFPTLFQMNMVLDWVIGPCSQLSSSFHICKRGGMCTSQPPWVNDLEGLLPAKWTQCGSILPHPEWRSAEQMSLWAVVVSAPDPCTPSDGPHLTALQSERLRAKTKFLTLHLLILPNISFFFSPLFFFSSSFPLMNWIMLRS